MTASLPEHAYCEHLDKQPGFPGCCHSCHDEWEAGYGEPMETELRDGRKAFVCCKVREWIEDPTCSMVF